MQFNFAALRDMAQAAGGVVRNAQLTAYELHQDMRTIDEMNRQYISNHAGTAPHWDNYDNNGDRTNGRNNNGNRSNNRRRNSNSNNDRQRQRDRSFERAHPIISRGLFYAMPHLGGYENGRGLTWNANGERWGDSFRRAADLINNVQEQRRQARAWESLGIDEPQHTNHRGNNNNNNNRRNQQTPHNNNNNDNHNELDTWRSPYDRPNVFDRLARHFDDRAQQQNEERRIIEEQRQRAEAEYQQRMAALEQARLQHEREAREQQEREMEKEREQAAKRNERIKEITSFEVKPGNGAELKEALRYLGSKQVNDDNKQANSPISEADRKDAQEKYRAFCQLVRPSTQYDAKLDETFKKGRNAYREYLATGSKNSLYAFQKRANDAYYMTDGKTARGFENQQRMELWKKVRRPEDTASTEDFRNNNQDEYIHKIFRNACKTLRPLLKEGTGLVALNRSEAANLLQDARVTVRSYNANANNLNETQFHNLEKRLISIRNESYRYKEMSDRNLGAYNNYCKKVAELNDNYGMNIPTYRFEDTGGLEYAKIDKLLEDAHNGKAIEYEPSLAADELIQTDNPYAKQQFDDAKSVSEFITNEAQYIPDDETEAHDINITQTQDGKYDVASPIPQSVAIDSADSSKAATAADILKIHYKGNNVTISIGNTDFPIDTFDNVNVIVSDDNRIVPFIDNQEALENATIDALDTDNADDESSPFAAAPSAATRTAAPSAATRSNAEVIRHLMENRSEEEVWVTEHMRSGFFINHYSRSYPHR